MLELHAREEKVQTKCVKTKLPKPPVGGALDISPERPSLQVKTDMYHKFKFKFKLSFIVIPLHVGTYSGTKCRASQDHGAA